MDRHQASSFLKALKTTPNKVNKETGWFQLCCPFANWRHESGHDNSPSMGMKIEKTKKSQFYCFACNFGGDAQDLLFELKAHLGKQHDLDIKSALAIAEKELDSSALALSAVPDYDDVKVGEELFEYPEWFLDSFKPVEVSKEAVAYLNSRGVPKSVRQLLDLRWDAMERRVCFPVRDFEGKLYGFHGRAIDPPPEDEEAYYLKYKMYPFMKHTNQLIWYGEQWVDFDKPILIVESVFDLARAVQVYRNTICPLRAGISLEKIERLNQGYYFVHMLDPDKAGQDASKKIKNAYPKSIHKDVKLVHGVDPGDTDIFDLQAILEKIIPLDEILLD